MRLQKINKTLKEFDHFTGGPNDKFAEVALAEHFPTFLTVPAYSRYLVDA